MTTVNHYKLWCSTENAYVYTWGTSPPTTCPHDTSHTVDTNTTVITESVSPNLVTIQAPSYGTNASYRVDCFDVPVAAGPNVVTTYDIVWPYNVSVRGTTLHFTSDNIDDVLNVVAAPDTTIGAITSDVTAGDTVINVTPTVFSYVQVGYFLSLSDGLNSSDLGEIIALNSSNGQVTVTVPADQNYSAASPTYVRFTVGRIRNFKIRNAGAIPLGQAEIGGTVVPAGTITRILYNNQSNTPKTFNALAEIFY